MTDQHNSKALYRRLLQHVKPYRLAFVFAIIISVIAGLVEPAIPATMGPLLDGSFVERDTDSALFFSLLLIALFTLRGVAQFAGHVGMSWVAHKVVMDLRKAMFNRLLTVPTSYYDHHASGKLLAKLTYDASQVAEASTTALVIIVRDTVTIIGLLGYLLYSDWRLTLIFFIIAPVIALIVKIISKRLRRLNLALQVSMGEMNSVADEATHGHKEIKLFGGQNYERKRFEYSTNWLRRNLMKVIVTAAASSPIVQLIAVVALGVIINFAAAREPTMSAGEFIAFFGAVALLFPAIKRLTNVNDPLQRGLAAAETVFAVIDEPQEIDHGTHRVERASGELEFKQVTFCYANSEQMALKNITLTIQPGETVALVGQSGSGKTTLASLIPRFYLPSAGTILLDGIDLQEIKLADLRNNLSLVSQHVVLFDDTIAANIAYGTTQNSSEEEIIRAAEMAHAMEFIREMPQGLNTLCGQNGTRLSGGQRQRIAIARAILKNAPILILDEATSALDTESERQVQAALETLKQGRTTLVIAHRLSTIENADRIVVMDQGEIIESGRHSELLAQGGRYTALYKIQFS